MRILRMLVQHVRSLLRGRQLDDDTRAELHEHFRRQIELHVAAGLTPEAARRAAVLEIGGVDQLTQASRDARGLAWWDTLRADLRYALRQMAKRPGFAAAAVLTLTIGVGATAAVFAVVDAVLLRPLPYPSAHQLYSLFELNQRNNVGRTNATALNFMDWREQSRTFSGLAGHIGTGFTLTGRTDPAFTVGRLVTTNLLDVLQVQPILGRTFLPHESEAGHHRVVILTHTLWHSHFQGDPSIVNQPTIMNGEPYVVIGVLPPGFAFPTDRYQLLTPLVTTGTIPGGPPINRGSRYLRVIGRLTDRATEADARAELDVIGKRLAEAYPDDNTGVSIGMARLADDVVGDTRTSLVVIFIAVGCVLLVACVNVAGLSIARGSARARELAIRTAIGASRRRLVRQLSTEAFLSFAIGGALGLLLSGWLVSVLVAVLPAALPRANEIRIDARFLVFGGLLTTVTGLVFSILPALQVVRRGAAPDLAGSRATVSASRSAQRTRATLIVAQIAAAMVLLTGALLAARSLQHVNAADKGFTPEHTLTFSVVLRDRRYPTIEDMRAFLATAGESLAAVSGVDALGTTTHLPLGDNNLENRFTVEGRVTTDEDPPVAGVRGVSGRYVAAIGARLLRGRDLLPSDTATSQPVAIVTDGFARRHLASGNPLGARIKMGDADSDDPWRTVVGVIADIRHGALDRPPRPEVWVPFAQVPADLATTWLRGVHVVARTGGSLDPVSIVPAVRDAIRRLDPDLPLVDLLTMEDLATTSTANRRLEASLLSGFASIAVTLAAVGLFGVLAYYVAQHIQEFGVRIALGATPSTLLQLVMGRGLLLLGIGLALGLPAAAAMAQGMSAILFGVDPLDPPALVAAVTVLTLVTLAACVLPARRAMSTDPLVALRND